MANLVQIANLAASLIGTQARVTSLEDDQVLARRVKAVWDLQRRATIREGEWNFACQRAGLPALDEAVSYPWAYAYELPAKALRLVEVLDCARDAYRLEGGNLETGTTLARRVRILTDHDAPLYVRYLVDVEQSELWDEQFADALAARIAWAIGKSIAGSTYDEAGGEKIYRRKLTEAKSTDARENPPLEQEEVGWVTARYGYYPHGPDPTRWG